MPGGYDAYHDQSGLRADMQTLNELLLQLGLGLVVALSLYVMGAILLKRGKGREKRHLDDNRNSARDHRSDVSMPSRCSLDQMFEMSGWFMIRLNGSQFQERFHHYANLSMKSQPLISMGVSIKKLDEIGIAQRQLGKQFMVLLALISLIFVATALSSNSQLDGRVTFIDFGVRLFSVIVIICVLFLLLPRLLMFRMYAQIDKLRHRLSIRLPNLIDLWVIGLESGQAPTAALLSALDQNSHPAFELFRQRVKRDVHGGLNLSDSLANFGALMSLTSLRSLAQLIAIAQSQGGPVAERLKQFADQSRQESFLLAENDALKAPLRLLAPLVTLIFPSTFIVLLFPVLYQLSVEFGR